MSEMKLPKSVIKRLKPIHKVLELYNGYSARDGRFLGQYFGTLPCGINFEAIPKFGKEIAVKNYDDGFWTDDKHIFHESFFEKDVKTHQEKQAEFEAVVRPVMKYMAENHHPHTTTIITSTAAEIMSGEMAIQSNEYLVD